MTQYQNNATLMYRHNFNDELFIIRVKPDLEIPEFIPGQYAELAIVTDSDSSESASSRLIRRSYSIASPAKRGLSEGLEFYLVRVQDGYLTPQLWNLKIGDRLWLGPKIKGKFTLEEIPTNKDLVMVSTGTGLAPFVSMLRTYMDNPPWRNVVIIHGARFNRDLGYRSELEDYASKFSWFHYIPTLTREAENSSWSGLRGRVQIVFENGLLEQSLDGKLTKDNTHFLLCGNPQMIDDIQKLLEERGFSVHKKKAPGNIHVERYW